MPLPHLRRGMNAIDCASDKYETKSDSLRFALHVHVAWRIWSIYYNTTTRLLLYCVASAILIMCMQTSQSIVGWCSIKMWTLGWVALVVLLVMVVSR